MANPPTITRLLRSCEASASHPATKGSRTKAVWLTAPKANPKDHGVPETIDELLADIKAVSARIDALDADDPKRERLEAQRSALRETAQHIADATRHPDAIVRHIEALETRLREIERLIIKQGYMEKTVGPRIQDPGAYSHNINKAIAEDHADEVRAINDQLTRLRAVAPQADDVEADDAEPAD